MTRHLPYLLILLGLLQPLSGALAPTVQIGTPIGAATRDLGAPEQPISAAFSIWSVIFLAYLGFGLACLRLKEPWMIRVAGPLAIAGLLNIVWMLSAQLIVHQPLDFALLFPIAAASWLAAWRFDRTRETGGSGAKLLADMATGMLAGWLSVAIAISIPLTIRSYTTLGATDIPWNMLWTTLVSAGFAAWLFANYISRSLWFFVALGWGLIGIIVNNWFVTGMNWLAIMSAVALVLIIALRSFRGATGSAHSSPKN